MKKNEIIWGFSEGFHDAGLSVVQGDQILFAGHSERYSKIKNDRWLNNGIIMDAMQYGFPDKVVYYENPYLKKTRQIYSKNWSKLKEFPKLKFMNKFVKYGNHHESHAAAGFYTSKFDDATVVVIDAIGEWDTCSIWESDSKKRLKKKKSLKYPNSLGLFYSAMTHYIGLKPNEEEYILMGMSSYGSKDDNQVQQLVRQIYADFFDRYNFIDIRLKKNLQKGCKFWKPIYDDPIKIATATQIIYENLLSGIMSYARQHSKSKNLVFMGGSALNCKANTIISSIWDDIWIMPNPGDAGSSLGAILAHTKQFVNWTTPFLGYDIKGTYPVKKIVNELMENKVVGVAKGRAEFGPRAFGNRSLLADPRMNKDEINKIKKREKFRPFAPMILEEDFDIFFEGVKNEYMQFLCKSLKPYVIPAVTHVDGTSRVQVVNKNTYPNQYKLLKEWKKTTGIGVLLNTSLNIKGQPLVNDEEDSKHFYEINGIKVL